VERRFGLCVFVIFVAACARQEKTRTAKPAVRATCRKTSRARQPTGGRVWPIARAMGKGSRARREPREGRQKWLVPIREEVVALLKGHGVGFDPPFVV